MKLNMDYFDVELFSILFEIQDKIHITAGNTAIIWAVLPHDDMFFFHISEIVCPREESVVQKNVENFTCKLLLSDIFSYLLSKGNIQ